METALGRSSKESMESEKCLDSELWHACAGAMVQMPVVNSKVYYFPQGHAEHARGNVDFGNYRWIPATILCRVADVKFLADHESDEVYAKIRLVPVRNGESEFSLEEDNGVVLGESQGKPASFSKTLTQSDANNGGGFSVPRYCADTIFPPLDMNKNPPVQNIFAKDVHGEIWKFRHIYRGTPRRHLLTTGWSTFVNQKKLIAGDSIVFLRTEKGELCVGIRRAKRGGLGGLGGGPESPTSALNPASCFSQLGIGFSVLLKEEERARNANSDLNSNGGGGGGGGFRGRWRVKPESVIEAATLAANGLAFEVVYYPRASTPEFCVKAQTVRAAMRIQWCSGMRFKMPFEADDSLRTSYFMGTIASVQVADPVRWPNSPWRVLQVTWDEPDLLQSVKRISPWLIELVSNMPTVHLSPFSPPRKKSRLPQHPDFPLDSQFPMPTFSGNPLGLSSPPCHLSDNTPAGIQGTRHPPLFHMFLPTGFQGLDHTAPSSRISTGLNRTPTIHDNASCLLTIGNSPQHRRKLDNGNTPRLVLFGQPIFTEQQMSSSCSGDTVSPVLTGNSSSDGNPDKVANFTSDGLPENSSYEGFPWYKDRQPSELSLEAGHCKVFMDSENVGRTLDLSVLGSYEELYRRLANMFGIEKSEMLSHVLYRDANGAVKHTGDEPFSDFMRTARKLTILMDLGSDSIGQ
eukprot:TRINITY_DN4836_c0_g2_i3.p1 TRINITY_DN4836_c0_g2~~TRINITY_DN4836_c0_g2_i3.p1  ORF type:complete len:688 (+),score=138.86 TRINITY_DN4836_c0_g2_i3:424-2487(+)